MKNIIVYDNFYENPDIIREDIIKLYYGSMKNSNSKPDSDEPMKNSKPDSDEPMKNSNSKSDSDDFLSFIDFTGKFNKIPGITKDKQGLIEDEIKRPFFQTSSFYTDFHSKIFEELLDAKIQYTCETNGIFIMDSCISNPVSININNIKYKEGSIIQKKSNIEEPDIEEWIGIVFLTPDSPVEGGITFYKNKKINSNSIKPLRKMEKLISDLILIELNNCNKDTTFWEVDTEIANVYNRLILLKKDLFYKSSLNYGVNIYDSRLIQFFSFVIYKD